MNVQIYKIVVTLVVVALAAGAGYVMYQRYEHRPWTRDAQVRANIVGIAPRVAGPVIQIPIRDNQPVRKGDLLFEIDPSTYQAAVDTAFGKLKQAQAALLQAKQELARQTELYANKVNSLADLQDAQDQEAAAEADAVAAAAELESAKLNLTYTKVFAPVDGYLTNVNTSVGTYVYAGQGLLALVDASSFWIAAYFKETQLTHIADGDRVELTLMGHSGSPFEGVIESIGWGIFMEDGSTAPDLLPTVSQTIDWVRLPQRFPVRIRATSQPPIPFRMGQTVSVSVTGPAQGQSSSDSIPTEKPIPPQTPYATD